MRRTLIAASTILFACTLDVANLVAEQPLSAPKKTITENIPLEAQPQLVPADTESIEMQRDPLFQAILQEFKAGRERLAIPSTEDTLPRPKIDDQGSSEKWRAVELILRAARILEKEDSRFVRETKLPLRNRDVVNQLRAQARIMIQNPDQP